MAITITFFYVIAFIYIAFGNAKKAHENSLYADFKGEFLLVSFNDERMTALIEIKTDNITSRHEVYSDTSSNLEYNKFKNNLLSGKNIKIKTSGRFGEFKYNYKPTSMLYGYCLLFIVSALYLSYIAFASGAFK